MNEVHKQMREQHKWYLWTIWITNENPVSVIEFAAKVGTKSIRGGRATVESIREENKDTKWFKDLSGLHMAD